MDFFSRLKISCEKKNSLLCVGLDPRLDLDAADSSSSAIVEQFLEKNRRIVGETEEFAASFKPNIAFYEAYGPAGYEALAATMQLIPPQTPVIIDAKRCDIGATAEAYASSLFGFFKADAVTLSPYMGRDSADPFLAYEGKGIFMLCRTSNPGAADFQELPVKSMPDASGDSSVDSREPLFISVAKTCTQWSASIGLVVAGNDPASLRAVRGILPEVWILAPGIGAQGGSAEETVRAGVRSDGFGILPLVVRSIANDPDPSNRAREYRNELNRGRETACSGGDKKIPALKDEVLSGLLRVNCFKLGSFTLKSGKPSPFYIDLRRVGSDAVLLRGVAKAYAYLLEGIEYDRIAGIPMAGLPLATAVVLETGKPLIYPRMDKKDHGTGNLIEGEFQKGDRVVLLDDLITAGTAKVEAAEILRAAGLEVKDLAVLIERGKNARRDMEQNGIALHAFLHINEFFAYSLAHGLIDEHGAGELEKFVEQD
jgi:uridine monophosphate synthetase